MKNNSLAEIRKSIVGIDEPVETEDGTRRPAINFDNASTTPVLLPVMEEVNRQLRMYGSIGRGFSQKSGYSTDVYDVTRRKVLNFLNAGERDYACVYVNNTTDGINKLASALTLSREDVVLATRLEHHSNDLPWRERCRVLYADVDELGRLRYDELERHLRENEVRYVTVTAASNVTGYVTDQNGFNFVNTELTEISKTKRFAGGWPAKTKVETKGILKVVFSAHKMYAPYGGGAVVALKDELDLYMPRVYGGGTVDIVSDAKQYYDGQPRSYEAGSPNYCGVVALGKAIDVLTGVGFDEIREHDVRLSTRLIDGLLKLGMKVYGDTEHIDDRVGVVTFNDPKTNSYLLAEKIGKMGAIATRRGGFCAHPYVWRLLGIADDEVMDYKKCADAKTPGMIRVSFGIYNTEEEVDELLGLLPAAIEAVKRENGDNPIEAPDAF